MKRGLFYLAAGLVAAAAVVALAHLPLARSIALRWGLRTLHDRASLDVTARDLSYNLLTLDVRVRGLTVAAAGSQTPFLTADDLSVDLPWRAVFGAWGVQRLVATGLVLDIVRAADGSLNLPSSADAATPSPNPPRVPVGALSLVGARVRYRDVAKELTLSIDGLNVLLAPVDGGRITGRVTTASGPSLHTPTLTIDGTLDGSLSYDGSSLELADVSYRTTPGQLRTGGRIDALWGTPALSLTIDGTAQLASLSRTLGIDPAVDGRVALNGGVTGRLSAPSATLTLTSDQVQWQQLAGRAVSAGLTLSTDGVRVDRASLQLGGGNVSGTGSLAFDSGTATVEASWQSVSSDALVGEPLPAGLGATLTGRAALAWATERGLRGLTGRIETRADAPSDPRMTGVAGTAELNLARETWRLRSAAVVAGVVSVDSDLSGRLPDASLATSSLRGTVDASAEASRLGALAARLGLTGRLDRIEAGRITAAVELSGALGAPVASGQAVVEDLRVAGSQPVAAVLPFTATLSDVRITGATATAGENRVEGGGAVNLVTRALSGDATVTLSDFVALGPAVTAWHPGGRLTGRMSLSGTTRNPLVRAMASGTDLAVASQRAARADLDVAYERGVVRASSVELTQADGGRATSVVTYVLDTGRSEISLRANGWRVSPVDSPAGSWRGTGVIDGAVDVTGTQEHPAGGGRVTLSDVRWDDSRLDRAVIDLTLSDAGLHAAAQIPTLGVDVDARVGQRAPYPATAVVTATDTSLAAVLAALGPLVPQALAHVEGALAAQVNVSGPLDNSSALSTDIHVSRLDLREGAAALRLAQPAAARFDGTTLTVQDLRLESGTSTADVSGGLGPASPGLTVVMRGALGDIAPWLTAAGVAPDLSIGGTFDATLGATGALDRLVVRGGLSVDQGRFEWAGYPAATDVAATVTLADGVVTAPALRATWQDAAATGALQLPLALLGDWLPAVVTAGLPPATRQPATSHLRLDHVTPAALASLAGDTFGEGLAGAASLDVDLRADGRTLDQVSGRVLVRELDLSAQGLPITQGRPTRLDIVGGVVRIADWDWDIAGSRLGVSGQATLTGDRTLDLAASGALDLRVLGAFLPDIATGGVGDLALTVRGTAAAPALNGSVRLRDGELRVREPAISLSNVTGLVALRPGAIDVTGLEGEMNGGRVAIIGGVSYQGLALTGGSLSLQATGVALDVPRGLRTEVDGSLALAFGPRVLLSGQVDITRGAYREPLSLAVELAAATRGLAAAPAATRPSLLDRLDLNVRLASRDPLMVDNNYGRMDLGVDVRLVGTASAPSIVGRASIAEGGVLFLGGRSYLIDRGVIDFSNPRAIVPDLDLLARARIRGTDESNALRDYDVTVAITGTPDTVKATLTSDPSRSQADIVSLLATGRLADQVGGAGAAVAREQVLGYLSGDALAFAAQAIGVDAIRFERDPGVETLSSDPSLAAEVNPVQRLTFSRRLTNQVNLTLSQNLVDTGLLTWIVSYAPRPSIEVRTVSRDDRSRSYQVRHDVSLGGSAAGPSIPRSQARDVRVIAVRVSGDLRFAERDVRATLRLSPGARFDYYRWQQDRDRLRAYYLDRGYREARVSARRVEGTSDDGDATVGLEYDVVPGPHAVIEVTGHRLPGRVVRELEEIWNNAVIDVSLRDDLADAVRRHLAEDGYLRARVEVALEPAVPGDKRIRVTVEPGPHAASRRMTFSGQARLSGQELRVAAAALGIEAWLQPKRLADEIALQYRQRGLLAASVTAGPIEDAAGAATLPVRIVEGEPFAIGQVVVRGAATRTDAAALKDLALTAGTPYTPATVRVAQAALDAGYARDGFNAAVTTIATAVDPGRAQVDLVVTVEEGPRQVLQAVEITGGEGLNAGVVADALGLTVDGPVDLNAWYASRRRLFQTGLFQRVDLEPAPVPGREGTATQQVRAQVSLVRRAPWHLRYGMDVTDSAAPLAEEGRVFAAGLSADLERYGVWGRPGTVGGSVRVNNDRRIARGFVTLPSLFGRSATSNVFVSRSRDYFNREGFVSFITDRTAITAEQRFLIRPTIQTAYGYQFERNHVFEPRPDPNAVLPLDERLQQARLTSTIVWDTRNDPFDTRRGLFHASNVEYAPEVLGSDVRFIKYSLQQYVFVQPVPGVVTASAFRLGIGRGFGQQLIPSERFFAGGGTTVRAFADNTIGGRDFFGDPVGGQGVLVMNQEMRFPLFRWVRGVGFVDAGRVFEQAGMLSFRSLDVGGGVGIRVTTPVGLVRLDVAKPWVTSLPRDQRTTRWWFSLGQAF